MADVALLGTGRMGAAMARRLSAAGHRLTLWNRTTARAQAVADSLSGLDVIVVDDPAAAVDGSAFVLSVLADGEATARVLLNPSVLAVLARRAIVCDLATSGVDAAHRVDAGLREAGVSFVDAPVSGSVPTVDAGQLLVMASGDAADVDALRPMLESFSRKVLHVGPVGAGQAMKLAVNLVVHDLNAALSEALVLAERAGIENDRAYDVLEESVVGAPFVKYKRTAFLDGEQPVAMSLDLVRKDLRLITGLAEQLGSPVPATTAVAEAVMAACSAGRGSQDMAALSRFLRDGS